MCHGQAVHLSCCLCHVRKWPQKVTAADPPPETERNCSDGASPFDRRVGEHTNLRDNRGGMAVFRHPCGRYAKIPLLQQVFKRNDIVMRF